ncbi:DUF952 domain-containing protein [Saprospiraceae bacterium]|nr:DUF952 domain-containing protein [Saprospiraceae bacterium]
MNIIYHIVAVSSWEEQLESSNYVHASLDQEGFIHASRATQIAGVLNRYYSGVNDLLKLTIDTDLLDATSTLREELAVSTGEIFPHIYGPINKLSIVTIEKIR